ncbi:hypothetical protein NDU88_004246 [Pleurodeles waltl]|uniref:Uncharacterized protein n=1 Tax=Pleurodeles waltl TaxID=8319 RepID=A0AAV7M6L4_PLEWA|nr:hypothetical protein NDU88_004246 [Pleurodeles waltl]
MGVSSPPGSASCEILLFSTQHPDVVQTANIDRGGSPGSDLKSGVFLQWWGGSPMGLWPARCNSSEPPGIWRPPALLPALPDSRVPLNRIGQRGYGGRGHVSCCIPTPLGGSSHLLSSLLSHLMPSFHHSTGGKGEWNRRSEQQASPGTTYNPGEAQGSTRPLRSFQPAWEKCSAASQSVQCSPAGWASRGHPRLLGPLPPLGPLLHSHRPLLPPSRGHWVSVREPHQLRTATNYIAARSSLRQPRDPPSPPAILGAGRSSQFSCLVEPRGPEHGSDIPGTSSSPPESRSAVGMGE